MCSGGPKMSTFGGFHGICFDTTCAIAIKLPMGSASRLGKYDKHLPCILGDLDQSCTKTVRSTVNRKFAEYLVSGIVPRIRSNSHPSAPVFPTCNYQMCHAIFVSYVSIILKLGGTKFDTVISRSVLIIVSPPLNKRWLNRY